MASTLEIIGELHINIQSMHDINHGNPEIDLLLHEMSALINELYPGRRCPRYRIYEDFYGQSSKLDVHQKKF